MAPWRARHTIAVTLHGKLDFRRRFASHAQHIAAAHAHVIRRRLADVTVIDITLQRDAIARRCIPIHLQAALSQAPVVRASVRPRETPCVQSEHSVTVRGEEAAHALGGESAAVQAEAVAGGADGETVVEYPQEVLHGDSHPIVCDSDAYAAAVGGEHNTPAEPVAMPVRRMR